MIPQSIGPRVPVPCMAPSMAYGDGMPCNRFLRYRHVPNVWKIHLVALTHGVTVIRAATLCTPHGSIWCRPPLFPVTQHISFVKKTRSHSSLITSALAMTFRKPEFSVLQPCIAKRGTFRELFAAFCLYSLRELSRGNCCQTLSRIVPGQLSHAFAKLSNILGLTYY